MVEPYGDDEYRTTLRYELTKEGFDWENGIIIIQYHYKNKYDDIDAPNLISNSDQHDHDRAIVLPNDHYLLDRPYESEWGSGEMPAFIAKDNERIYFPGKYDGATWVESVEIDIKKYLDIKRYKTPYVGGG